MPGSVIPKTAGFELLHFFPKTVKTIQTKNPIAFLHHIRILYVQWIQIRIGVF